MKKVAYFTQRFILWAKIQHAVSNTVVKIDSSTSKD